MFIELFLKGLMIGFSIAMPVGPIGLLCIRNVLTFGILCGFVTGLGAACADTIYGALAGFGVTAISTFLESNGTYLKSAGAFFLCYLGISTFLAKSSNLNSEQMTLSHSRAFLATFFLTLTNPMTIISFAGVYAGLGLGSENSGTYGAFLITFGVLLGSAAWWIILSLTASFFREKMSSSSSLWLNKFSGSVLFGFGAIAFIS